MIPGRPAKKSYAADTTDVKKTKMHAKNSGKGVRSRAKGYSAATTALKTRLCHHCAMPMK